MTDALFSALELKAPGRPGYRLERVEVFNWGTFDRRAWKLLPGGETTLLTGDIGSGKSTLVDAVTTLLLPAHRIAYNKAAGAEAKERTLRSYVEGHYKSERVEATGASRAIGLRDSRSYSVILGVFVNDGYDETVSIAQVFQQRDAGGQPYRFFVTATRGLTVEDDFTDFGTTLPDLRRRLRDSGAEVHDDFPRYGERVRRLLGIRSPQAMDLFHQTVSMKSVGNLNEFVRTHMLEPADATGRISGIIAHFDDLTKAHEAVRRAREQLEALEPLAATGQRFDEATARRVVTEEQRDAVRLFVTELRLGLLGQEIEAGLARQAELEVRVDRDQARLKELELARTGLIEARARAGGHRVAELERAISDGQERTARLRQQAERHATWLAQAGLPEAHDVTTFAQARTHGHQLRGDLETRRGQLDQQRLDARREQERIDEQAAEIRAELESLASRTSNLPSSQLDLRAQLCHDLGLTEEDLPFAGELMDVRDEHRRWRGAAERVLRGFALSLLVPQRHHGAVAAWVDERRLTHRTREGRVVGSRLVYERVPERRVALQPPAGGDALLLADTLDVADGPFGPYLRDQLWRRADHRCVDTLEEFRRERRAVTMQGQVRSGDRHEKDDRRRVDDPRSWVLGWANEQKVEALTAQLLELHERLGPVQEQVAALAQESQELERRLTALTQLGTVTAWDEIDWASAAAQVSADEHERARLVSGSSELAEIEGRLTDNDEQQQHLQAQLNQLRGDVAVVKDRVSRATRARDADQSYRDQHPGELLEKAHASYPALEQRITGRRPTSAEECGRVQEHLSGELQGVLDRLHREINGYTTSLLQYMAEIRRRWPEATTEMDADIAALGEYRTFHEQVARDDLPRFEEEFKRQLNTNTIRELAQLNSWLRRQSDEIRARVDRINEALGAIDFNPGRYVRLETERTVNQEVQAFRTDLRAATDDSLAVGDDHYTEERFLEVARLIERFRGRPGHADADRAWTRRVTDVRNWFTFSASERDRDTDEEWEHYRDSDGKSGGQKEKLAYTILAASLAYQFGLAWGAEKSRDFRFAVIDEAFGRGSDASTRFALDLFAKLGLQLLIVTPLQKVHVIEPYVRAIGFVDNPSGRYSRLQTMTIEEFTAQREERARSATGP